MESNRSRIESPGAFCYFFLNPKEAFVAVGGVLTSKYGVRNCCIWGERQYGVSLLMDNVTVTT